VIECVESFIGETKNNELIGVIDPVTNLHENLRGFSNTKSKGLEESLERRWENGAVILYLVGIEGKTERGGDNITTLVRAKAGR